MGKRYAVSIPARRLSQWEFNCLLEIIAYNARLLQRALGTQSLMIVFIQNRLWFPWFTLRGEPREMEAYHDLVTRLYLLAKDGFGIPVFGKSAGKWEMRQFLKDLGLHDAAECEILLRNFGWHAVPDRCRKRITHILSDIRTCFLKRSE